MNDQLPPFDDIDLMLEDAGASLDAAGVHGLLTGLACSGAAVPLAELRSFLRSALGIEIDDNLFRELRAMDKTARKQLVDDDLGFEILLPDDEDALEDRVRGMSDWCTGFLAGFESGTQEVDPTGFPEDVVELLDTMRDFTDAELDGDADMEAERDYAEIVEYLRIAALTIHLEIAAPRDGGAPPNASLH